jgi:hypothetical protein
MRSHSLQPVHNERVKRTATPSHLLFIQNGYTVVGLALNTLHGSPEQSWKDESLVGLSPPILVWRNSLRIKYLQVQTNVTCFQMILIHS